MADVFQPKFVDLVRNSTTTTGTDDFVLGPAVNGFSSFTDACEPGDQFYYAAIGVDKAGEREVGRGTLLAGGVIGRDPVSGSKTNFTSASTSIALVPRRNGSAISRCFARRASRSPSATSRTASIP